ncbi:collagen-like protein [Wolbachia endosymbiont (group B) of Germaria angustata]|uniref:collagen-like protein n=1 Tax=Wolbachia endosymbiont (group B) of Germaria angustata TaxID=3077916 RepID=UPI003132B600
MRFNLEPGDTFCDGESKLVNVKINDEERINLPYISYVFDHEESFIISNFMLRPMNIILTNSSQRLNLKLEKVGGDYKLALVDGSDQYYYVYYYNSNISKIATFNSIPSNFIEYRGQEYIQSYAGECSVNLVPLINSRVLVDPKDIMSNKDVDFVLKELEKLPDKRLRIGVGKNFLRGPEKVLSSTYKSAEVYGIRGNKIGILNNIATSFSNKKLKLFSGTVSIDIIDQFGAKISLKKTNPHFRIKKLNNDNYVGCLLSKYGKCERFYALTPESFEQEKHTYIDYDYDYEEFEQQSHHLHPYYYYLHNLKVSMNHRKIEELEKKVKDLENRIGNLQLNIKSAVAMPGPPGLRGLPGPKGNQGHPGLKGNPGEKGEHGYSGSKGDRGIPGLNIIGEKGDPGEMGLRGFKGDVGPSGLKGQSGAKGDKGDSGMKGETGPQGVDGMPGVHGPKGEKGNVGPIGPQGLQGSKGYVGRSGSQGDKGDTGTPGRDGLPGASGLKGDIGPIGPQGIKGKPGINGTKGIPGLQGPTGSKGDKGRDAIPEEVAQKLINNGTIANEVLEYRDQGGDLVLEKQVTGRIISNQDIQTGIAIALADNRMEELADVLLRGANHTLVEKLANNTELTQSISEELRKNPGEVQGPKGEKGEIGSKGEKGNVGPIGPQGLQGSKGYVGRSGSQGDKGDTGTPGRDGLPGASGLKGDIGPIGPQGIKGKPGINGTKGIPGLQGPTGSKGDKGRDAIPEEVAQKLINNGTIANEVLEYRDQGGDLVLEKQVTGRIISNQDIQTGIAIALADNRMEELADVLLRGANHTLVEKLANNTELTQSISEELRKNPGEVQGPKGEKGEIGSKGEKGGPGANGLQGPKGSDGLPGPKGEIGLQGPKGKVGRSGLKGSKGDIGLTGIPDSKGEDEIGAALADKFLYEIKKVKNETLNAKDSAEVAKNASESFAKEAKNANDNIIELHNKTENLTKKAEVFCNASKKSASDASVSESNTKTFYSQTQKMFCVIQPDDKSCVIEKRDKREIINSPLTSGASRPTSFISQVINFFYPAAGQDEYKIKNEIQEVAKIIDAADIVTKFEEVLGETAVKCGISKKSLNFDPVELQSTIVSKSLLNDENHNELLKFLCVTAKKSLPNYKQISKCLSTFRDHMEKRLKDNEQQRALVNTEKIVADNEQPRSFMTYVAPPSSLSAINQQVVGYLR